MADAMNENEGQPSGFPKSPSDFDADDRVSFSKVDNKFLLETDEGTEYEWDSALRRWIPVLDQELLDQQAAIYRIEGADEEAAQPQQQKKKRKQDGKNDETGQKSKKQRLNTAVYVTSIPLTASRSEIHTVFSRCGVIAEEIDSGDPRIKMYEDDQGQFKGDALVVYFRPESVQLAIQMLDDSDFRLGEEGLDGRMRVVVADQSYKKVQQPEDTGGNKVVSGGEKIGPVKRKGDQKKIIKKTQKLNSKLADWDDDDPQVLQQVSNRFDKVVILKRMFTLAELEDDPAAMLEIKEDVREECAKLGEVTNVVLFDKEVEGVMSVRFANAEATQACLRLMDGRWFEERQVEAYIATGNEKFKKSKTKQPGFDSEDEVEGGEGGRLDKFGEWLEEKK